MKYLINGFKFLANALEKNMKEYRFEYVFPKPSKFDFVTNFLLLRRLIRKGKIKKFDVVHINNWENFINIPSKKERKNQIWICESHGIHIGLDYKIGASMSTGIKKVFALLFGKAIHFFLSNSIKKFDISYVSIPNALYYAKKIRKDSLWLPNPINTKIFCPKGKKMKLEGSPAVIYPTRLHDIKNPKSAFFIFKKIKERYPLAKLHLIKYPKRYTKEYLYGKDLSAIESDLIYHHFFKNPKELAKFYRSGNIILGSFNPHSYYANLNLVELQAMACGVPVVTHDIYEIIKIKLKDLPKLALDILGNKKFRQSYIKRNLEYIGKIHSYERVSILHMKNLKNFFERLL